MAIPPDPSPAVRNPDDRTGDTPRGRVFVAFLVGPAAPGMTGDTIHVDGGLHNVA
jgi:enoyl-[acyl-carrier protein] reductase I